MKVELNDKDVENFLFFVDVALKQLGVTHAEIATSLILKLKAAKIKAQQNEGKIKESEVEEVPDSQRKKAQENFSESSFRKDAIKKTIESDESRTTQP